MPTTPDATDRTPPAAAALHAQSTDSVELVRDLALGPTPFGLVATAARPGQQEGQLWSVFYATRHEAAQELEKKLAAASKPFAAAVLDLRDVLPFLPPAPLPAKRPRGRPPLAPGQSRAKSNAELQAAYRARGRYLSVTLTDAAALAVLERETATGRTIAATLEWALIAAGGGNDS